MNLKSQDKYVIEFEYEPEMLTSEKKQQIIDNLKTWTLPGQYPETDIEPKYSPSEVEWKKANAKMLNYVNTHSSKIQKYAETIDNSQTEERFLVLVKERSHMKLIHIILHVFHYAIIQYCTKNLIMIVT